MKISVALQFYIDLQRWAVSRQLHLIMVYAEDQYEQWMLRRVNFLRMLLAADDANALRAGT